MRDSLPAFNVRRIRFTDAKRLSDFRFRDAGQCGQNEIHIGIAGDVRIRVFPGSNPLPVRFHGFRSLGKVLRLLCSPASYAKVLTRRLLRTIRAEHWPTSITRQATPSL